MEKLSAMKGRGNEVKMNYSKKHVLSSTATNMLFTHWFLHKFEN
jgi:hypothetical protein